MPNLPLPGERRPSRRPLDPLTQDGHAVTVTVLREVRAELAQIREFLKA